MDTILFLGVFTKDSTNISQANAFEKNGCTVIRHDFRANPNLPADMGFDLIFYSKCNELGIDAVTRYKGIKCIWYMDPLNGNYSSSFLQKVGKVDFVCFALYDPWLKTAWTSYGQNKPCYLIEEGYDPNVDDSNPGVEYQYDVSFIGNLYDKKRQYYHENAGFNVINCSRIDHPLEVARSKINLNFTNGGTSDRAYKIIASHGFLLSEPWPGCPFEPGKHFVTFTSLNELREKIKYYLHHWEERSKIAANGYLKVKKYSRTNWAKRILKIYRRCKQ